MGVSGFICVMFCLHLVKVVDYFYRQQTKFWKGNVFTPVCHSVQGGRQPSRQIIHQADTPEQTPPGQTSTWVDSPLEMVTVADGTHPTGMHSC